MNTRTADGSTALLNATFWRRLDVVRDLLEYGADVHAADDRGWNVLGIAMLVDSEELIELLRRYARRARRKARE